MVRAPRHLRHHDPKQAYLHLLKTVGFQCLRRYLGENR